MAYLLGIGILRGVIRPAENTGNVCWRHAAKRYSHVFHDSHGRSVLEEDALVALAGAAAQWLYKQGSVRASAMSFDDEMATSILAGMEPEMNVASNWREYLRQRALAMLTSQRCQAMIARLAGRFVERERLRGAQIETFLLGQEDHVRPFLRRDGNIETYIGLIGTDAFAKAVETLQLCAKHYRKPARQWITTVGRLLQFSTHDLSPMGLRGEPTEEIERAVAQAGFELPKYPRSNFEMVSFDPQFVYDLDRDLARRRAEQ